MGEIAARVERYLREEIAVGERRLSRLDDRTPLLGSVLDSMGMMRLVAFLEEEFAVVLDDDDLTIEHFRTVADIESLVVRKQEAAT